MSPRPPSREPVCHTCGDVAEAMVVLEVREAEDLALCLPADGEEAVLVQTGLLGTVTPGEGLLVHAGTALARQPA